MGMTNTQIARYDHLLTTTYRSLDQERELSLLMRLYQSHTPTYQREVAA